MHKIKFLLSIGSILLASQPGLAQEGAGDPNENLTYADIVGLADQSSLVIHAQITRQRVVERERSPGIAPGFVRLYIEADTRALIAGSSALGESLTYLVDVPLNTKGKPPKLKKQEVLLFARPVQGSATAIQLMGAQGQFFYTPQLMQRIRPVLSDLASADSPPVIHGVRDALSVPGNLTGESETQIFLETDDGSPVSITILRRPGRPAAWGVSWGEIIDQAARPPRPHSLAWYRLACALPERLPSSANLAYDPASRSQANRDYGFVMGELGPCVRSLPIG